MFFAAIETACWDIVGQTVGRPVYVLFGGRTIPSQTDSAVASMTDRTVEFAFRLGICSLEQFRTKAIAAKRAGFTTLKTKGGRDWQADVERIIAMDAATDGPLEFRLDPNQGWRPAQTLRAAVHLRMLASIYSILSNRSGPRCMLYCRASDIGPDSRSHRMRTPTLLTISSRSSNTTHLTLLSSI